LGRVNILSLTIYLYILTRIKLYVAVKVEMDILMVLPGAQGFLNEFYNNAM
jgi:hypothetical protein